MGLYLFIPRGLTFLGHANLEALLQPAVLAAVACDLVNLTVFISVAGVHHVLLNTATEETLEHQEARHERGEGRGECTIQLSYKGCDIWLLRFQPAPPFITLLSCESKTENQIFPFQKNSVLERLVLLTLQPSHELTP